jgi:(R,R)-butanediol dehydrogenase/meso-butanediol dehydrogenase/diacetyl reductase
MRAARYNGSRRMLIEDVDTPAPQPGEVQLDVRYVGICGTDLHIFHGDMDERVSIPAVIGHEMVGVIAQVGPDVTGWQPGMPVTVMPIRSCGQCAACVAGHSHVCQRLNFLGIDSTGAMQQRWNVPSSTLIEVPHGIDMRAAALIEPTAVAVHDVARSDLRAGDTTLVVGGGPVGLLIATVAKAHGADVVVVEPDAYRRSVAEQVGLRVLDAHSPDLRANLDTWTDGAGVAVCFEVSGAEAGVELAVDALAVRGRLVMVAIHPKPRLVNLHRFFWRELTMAGARLYGREDFEKAVNLVASGAIPSSQLISRVEPLDRVGEAFAALESGSGVMKVLIDCQDV